MASFASQPQRFSEYTPQYNVGLYSQIGQQNQAQYEQGYQQIQQAFDRVGGIELSRDVDKNYLKGKLDESLSKANQMAGADFAKQGVVSNLTSMAATIANDGNVQRAAQATISVKKALAEVEDARKKGEGWAPENQAYLDNQLQSWYKDPEVGTPFQGGFVRYTDNNKALQEFLKEKHPNSTLTQQPSGEYVLIERDGKSISAEDIRNETRQFLQSDGRYMQQSQINGWYAGRNANPEALIDRRLSNRASNLNILEQNALKLKDSQDPKEAAAAIEQLSQIVTAKQNMQKDRQSLMALSQNNPSAFHTDMYIDNTANMMADRYSFSEVSEKIVKSPLFDAQQQQLANKIAYDKYLDDQAFHVKDSLQKDKQFEFEQQKWEWQKTHGKAAGDGSSSSGAGGAAADGAIIPGAASTVGGPTAKQSFEGDLTSLHASLDSGIMDVMSQYAPTQALFTTNNTGTSLERGFVGRTPEEVATNKAEATKQFYELLTRYNNGEKLDPKIADKLANYTENNDIYQRMVTVKQTADAQWNAKTRSMPQKGFSPQEKTIADYDKIEFAPKTYLGVDGKNQTIDKASILAAAQLLQRGIIPAGGGTGRSLNGFLTGQQLPGGVLSKLSNPISTIPAAIDAINSGALKVDNKAQMLTTLIYLKNEMKNPAKVPKAIGDINALVSSPGAADLLSAYAKGDTKAVERHMPAQAVAKVVKGRDDHYTQQYLPYIQLSGNNGQLVPHSGEDGQVLAQQLTAMLTSQAQIVVDGQTSTPEDIAAISDVLKEDFKSTAVTWYQPKGQDPYYMVAYNDKKKGLKAAKFTIPLHQAQVSGLLKTDPVEPIRTRLNLDVNKTSSNGILQSASTGTSYTDAMRVGEVKDNDGSFFLKYNVEQSGPGQYYVKLYAKDVAASKAAGRDVVLPIPYQSTADNSLEAIQQKMKSLISNPRAATLIRAAINGGTTLDAKPTGDVGSEVSKRLNPYLDLNNPNMNP